MRLRPVALLLVPCLLAAGAVRANTPPSVDVTSPVSFTLSQGSFSTTVQAVERAQSAASFYDYFSASSHTGFEAPNESKIFLYRDTTTGLLSLFITHNIDANTSGLFTGPGSVRLNLGGVPPGAFVAQSDDPFQGFRAELDLALEPEGFWDYSDNTDGGVVDGLPTDQPWCMTIEPLSFVNVTSWVYHYASGAPIALDLSQTVTICFVPAADLDTLDVDEGNDASFSGSFDDPDAADVHVAGWDFGDGSTAPATHSPGAGFTHHDCDPVFHAFGDDGTYPAVLSVDDDAGNHGQDTLSVRVHNVAPAVVLGSSFVTGVGIGLNIPAQGTDPGSDDLAFAWDFGDGSPIVSNDHYNDGVAPDGTPTPAGIFPFTAVDLVHHAWCEPGTYVLRVDVADDDGGATTRTATVQVLAFPTGSECNDDPACSAGPDLLASCGPIQVLAGASDPQGDPLSFAWSSSCPGTAFAPGPDVEDPLVTLPPDCDEACVLTLVVGDGHGGSCTDDVTVRLRDDAPPAITACPGDVVVECDGSGNGAQHAAWLASFAAADACGSVTLDGVSGVVPGCGSTSVESRTFLATDACSNTASCPGTFRIVDTTPPSLAAGSIGACYSSAAAAEGAAIAATGASDACSSPVALTASTSGSCAATIVVTGTDACGNSASVSYSVLIDSAPPSLSGVPANATVACNAVPLPASPTATDACDAAPVVTFAETRANGACADSYVLTRTWTATDRCGNASSASQVITVQDVSAPALSGVPANATVACNAVPLPASPTATDACDAAPVVTFAQSTTSGPCPDSYVLTRTWTATDRCGNAASASQVITVQDVVAPTLSGVPANATVACNAVPPPANPTASDACDPAPAVTFAETRADGACPGSYVLTRTWTATDRCGNAASRSQVVTVEDREGPVVAAGLAPIACLWPPNHRMVSFDAASLTPDVRDACSEPVTWRITGCASDQPENSIGDGNTEPDCVVAADGLSFAVRSERQGTEPSGRRYAVQIVATDACGNSSSPTTVGTILVPHDQAPHEDCIKTAGKD